jgi:transcription elongation factor
MSYSLRDALRRESIRSTWQPGDQVDVIDGELVGLSGELKSFDLELWSAEVAMLIGGRIFSQQFSLHSLVRRVSLGANVIVVGGKSKERRGIVVYSGGEYVTFIEDDTREEVSLL